MPNRITSMAPLYRVLASLSFPVFTSGGSSLCSGAKCAEVLRGAVHGRTAVFRLMRQSRLVFTLFALMAALLVSESIALGAVLTKSGGAVRAVKVVTSDESPSVTGGSWAQRPWHGSVFNRPERRGGTLPDDVLG